MRTLNNKKNWIIASLCLLVGAGIGAGIQSIRYLPFSWDQSLPYDKGLQGQGHAPRMPAQLDFAGEMVPLEDREVRERLDRELIVNTYRHGSTVLLLKKAAQWLPVMEDILRSEGVPTDFLYLCMAESDLGHVVSSSGAAGFWQFMKPTAAQYGLVVNEEVDQRYDIEKSTHAACKYLKSAYAKFGSWTMAAASYNMGMAGLEKSAERQGSGNYYDLFLNTETSRYVFRILALKLIHQQPEAYGYHLEKEDLYQPYKYAKQQVAGPVNSWVDFAVEHGINYKQLRQHNMWIRDAALRNPERRIYSVKIIRE
jgi:membrane-bound lytic murein transglycosylase D